MAEGARLTGLYAITPDWTDTARLLAVTDRILAGGCRVLQYRHKSAAVDLKRAQAAALFDLARRHGALFIINDDLDLALRLGADGVHLGLEDGDPAMARTRLGPGRLLGVSCYQSLAQARLAEALGADYVAFGSFHPSPTKPQAGRADASLLSAARRVLRVPVVAIGGIGPDNAAPLVVAGADLLAVISALYDASDPEAAARSLARLYA